MLLKQTPAYVLVQHCREAFTEVFQSVLKNMRLNRLVDRHLEKVDEPLKRVLFQRQTKNEEGVGARESVRYVSSETAIQFNHTIMQISLSDRLKVQGPRTTLPHHIANGSVCR